MDKCRLCNANLIDKDLALFKNTDFIIVCRHCRKSNDYRRADQQINEAEELKKRIIKNLINNF